MYVSRFITPAYFASSDVKNEIGRLSQQFSSKPHIKTHPATKAIIAYWGAVTVEELDPTTTQRMATGESLKLGFLVDFLGNPQRSAQQSLPIYRLGGGPGFVWQANWDENGKGTLSFRIIDASALPSVPQNQSSIVQDSSDNLAAPTSTQTDIAQTDSQKQQTTVTVDSSDPSAKRAEHTIEVVGAGGTAEEARHDAARQAIEQAVGVLVDSTRAYKMKLTDQKLTETLSDSVFSYSNAFIEKLDVLNIDQSGGMYKVRARVTVTGTKLIDRLKALNIPTKPETAVAIDTPSVSEHVLSRSKEAENASTLVDKLLREGLDFYDVQLNDKPVVIDSPLETNKDFFWMKTKVRFTIKQETVDMWKKAFAAMADAVEVSFPLESIPPRPDCGRPIKNAFPDSYNYRSVWGDEVLREYLNRGDVEWDQLVGRGGGVGHVPYAVCFGLNRQNPMRSQCFVRVVDEAKLLAEVLSRRGWRLNIEVRDRNQTVLDSAPFGIGSYPNFYFDTDTDIQDEHYFSRITEGNQSSGMAIGVDDCGIKTSGLGVFAYTLERGKTLSIGYSHLIFPLDRTPTEFNLYIRISQSLANRISSISISKAQDQDRHD